LGGLMGWFPLVAGLPQVLRRA
jgi:hypothetical protein